MPYKMECEVSDADYEKLRRVVGITWNNHQNAKDIYDKMIKGAVLISKPSDPALIPPRQTSAKAEAIWKATTGVAGASR